MGSAFDDALARCARDKGGCEEAARQLLSSLCPDLHECGLVKGRPKGNYEWIEKLLKTGVPDGRHRLILYVISRYLVNVKGLTEDEALKVIHDFLDLSCKNFKNCSKVYDSWIKNVVRKVKEGGWKPWSLDKIKSADPDLFSKLEEVLAGNGG